VDHGLEFIYSHLRNLLGRCPSLFALTTRS
jgi:hypothetical protein